MSSLKNNIPSKSVIVFTKFSLVLVMLLFATQFSFSQKKDENIGTEVVNVVKPYTPTISDAFKVKETPTVVDEETSKKEEIKYSIFSFPVASTFAPSKGKAATVDKAEQERIFKNYATLGLGNYLTVLAELYVTENVSDTDYFGGYFKHLSSQGGIKNLILDDKYSDSTLDLTYGSKQQTFAWTADLGYNLRSNFWYGLPSNFGSLYSEIDKNKTIDAINKSNSFSIIHAGGNVNFNKNIFKSVKLDYYRFGDAFKSAENNLVFQPTFEFDAAGTTIKTKVIVDYLGGSFKKDYTSGTSFNYGITNLGIQPSIAMQKRDWSFNLGAGIFYSLDIENKKNKFLIYPQVNASLALVENIMIFYAGAEGTLEQNSYRELTTQNPFLAPSQVIAPTDRQFDIFGGLKGKVSNNLSYNLRASVISEKNKALFTSNPFSEVLLNQQNYQYGNSFRVVYDDVKTLRFYGELKANFTKDVSFGLNGTFSKYSNNREIQVWNLPAINLGANLDINVTPRWNVGANIFFVGDRNEQYQTENLVVQPANIIPSLLITNSQITLKSYFDANAHVNFKYTDRLTAFLRLNNLGNQGYQKWINYPVQSFQFMLGASYKFDF